MAIALLGWAQPAASQTLASAFTSGVRYDAMRRTVGTIASDPDGSGPIAYAAVRNTYDADGRLIRVETGQLSSWQSQAIVPANWSGFTVFRQVDTAYDTLDRKVQDTVSSGGTAYEVTQYSYDVMGRPMCTAVRMTPTSFGSLPDACTLSTEGSGSGDYGPDRITRNFYDPVGQVLKVQKAVGTSLQQYYATYTYTANGKVATMTDANGNLASMNYDGLDREAAWYFPSPVSAAQSSTTDYEAYGYDANGNRTSLRKRDGRTLTYNYDALNRVTTKIVPDGCAPIQSGACTPAAATRDVYYGYDAWGRQTDARFDSPGGDGIHNVYDGFGRLVQTFTSMAGLNTVLSYGYDADSNRTSITHPDGQAFTYAYDGLDRLSVLYEGTSVVSAQWQYDAHGNLVTLTDRFGSATSYAHDGVERLSGQSDMFTGGTGNVTYGFGYNPASQITSEARDNDAYAFTGYANVNRAYGVNGLNQYTSAGPATFAYDANGNLISDGTTSYTYDAENRLVAASNGASLVYDPLGRLFQTSGGSAGLTQLLYDGDKLTAEYDGSGNLLRRYVHGVSEDDPILWYEGGQLVKSYHSDHEGSIVAVANGPNGALVGTDSYDEYGIPGVGNSGRFQYTGQAWIPELGMYYYKARMYSPTLGRFMQTDPIDYKDQNNLYEYVGDDPVDGRDPTGNARELSDGAFANSSEGCAGSITCKDGSGAQNTASNSGQRNVDTQGTDQAVNYTDGHGKTIIDPYTGGAMQRPADVHSDKLILWGTAGVVLGIGSAETLAAALFRRNGPYDSQRTASHKTDRAGHKAIDKSFISIGNYNYGVYAAAANFSRSEALAGAAIVNNTGKGAKDGPLGSSIKNNISIFRGYDDFMNGNVGH